MSNSIYLPDYTNSILGIPNSILSHYGAEPHHSTLSVLDRKLIKGYKNIVLWILDGMGMDALKTHAPDGFLMQNCVSQLNSVSPCTTTSAMTTFETGLTPIEHGWLGWSHYFKEIGKCVDLFTNRETGTKNPAADKNIVWETIGYKNLFTQIQEVDSNIECCRVSSFWEYWSDTNEAICNHIENLCKKDGRRYIIAHHFQPDHDMHDYGCYCERTKANIVLFDKQIEQLAARLTDTLLIVTADHGLTDIKMLDIADYPELHNCLSTHPTREPRNLSFFVKPEYKDIYPKLWNNQFGNDFHLMTGAEAAKKGFFGNGNPHKHSKDFLGDYIAMATGGLSVWYKNDKGLLHNFKACHAGLTENEMIVPLILIESE